MGQHTIINFGSGIYPGHCRLACGPQWRHSSETDTLEAAPEPSVLLPRRRTVHRFPRRVAPITLVAIGLTLLGYDILVAIQLLAVALLLLGLFGNPQQKGQNKTSSDDHGDYHEFVANS